jgi:hypothetical protein
VNALFENPFVLFLFGVLASAGGALASRLLDNAFGSNGRLATIEATLGHVVADQAAHAQHATELALLRHRAANIEQALAQIMRQNRAIWKKLNV